VLAAFGPPALRVASVVGQFFVFWALVPILLAEARRHQLRAVEEGEEMEREGERGAVKRPDLNKLDVPEWAELVLDKLFHLGRRATNTRERKGLQLA
jgi:hypothetical protein